MTNYLPPLEQSVDQEHDKNINNMKQALLSLTCSLTERVNFAPGTAELSRRLVNLLQNGEKDAVYEIFRTKPVDDIWDCIVYIHVSSLEGHRAEIFRKFEDLFPAAELAN